MKSTRSDLSQVALQLKKALKARSEEHLEPSRVRIHRSISWLTRAAQEVDDFDVQFVFLWIAFNAAYAKAFGSEETSRAQLASFFTVLDRLDDSRTLNAIVMKQFSGPIRTLISNRYVFEPFWKALRDHDASSPWERLLQETAKAATRATLDGRLLGVLPVVFDRLYVLRNQLVHGGATWNSAANRLQVKDGAHFMGAFVPAILQLMIEHPEADFGEVMYPVV
jgi:hypothetical protein